MKSNKKFIAYMVLAFISLFFLVPYLVSAKSTMMVVAGVGLGIFSIVCLVDEVFKLINKSVKEEYVE